MAFELRTAQRKKAKLRIGLGGPSGSGKTYSALLMANGFAPWEKIALIDTENGSGELYSDLGAYNVITLQAPFTPERYIEAIQACEKAGMEVIIIDSITHEWDGEGGCLEIVEKLGGRYQDWAKVTPRHKAFLEAILQSPCHVITTVRKKQDYEMTKDSNGRVKVEKMGMKEITREGFEYELTLSFEILISHLAKASKDRTKLFMDKPEFVISQETGKILAEWADSGAVEKPTDEQTKRFNEQLTHFKMTKEQWEEKTKLKWDALNEKKAQEWIVVHDKKIKLEEDQKKKDDEKKANESPAAKQMREAKEKAQAEENKATDEQVDAIDKALSDDKTNAF